MEQSMKIVKKASPENEIEINFTYHIPKGNQQEKYKSLRTKSKELAYIFNELCPDSKEKELAMVRLEEALMWANASIARHE